MDMDFDFADAVSKIAVRHARKGTPIEKAWPEVVAAAQPKLSKAIAKVALSLPITASLVQVTATYASLIARDRPGKKIKGLWFGLVELCDDGSLSNTWVTPYIAGTSRFDPQDEDWPCDVNWFPDGRYAMNPAMYELSVLRGKMKAKTWYIDTTLIEPLNTLLCGALVHGAHPDLLLGPATRRGVGCGFDSGDLHTLGVIDKDGFKPL